MFYTSTTVHKMTACDSHGVEHTVEHEFDPSLRLIDVFRAAFGSEHSTPEELDRIEAGEPAVSIQDNPALWLQARGWIGALTRLKELCAGGTTS